eukprot:5690162-Pyramimonas_sp.AAC.1
MTVVRASPTPGDVTTSRYLQGFLSRALGCRINGSFDQNQGPGHRARYSSIDGNAVLGSRPCNK